VLLVDASNKVDHERLQVDALKLDTRTSKERFNMLIQVIRQTLQRKVSSRKDIESMLAIQQGTELALKSPRNREPQLRHRLRE
jgi:hypothetical protein